MHDCVRQHISNPRASVRGKYHPSYGTRRLKDYSRFSAIALDGSHICKIAVVFSLHANGGASLPVYIPWNQHYAIPAGAVDNGDRPTYYQIQTFKT